MVSQTKVLIVGGCSADMESMPLGEEVCQHFRWVGLEPEVLSSWHRMCSRHMALLVGFRVQPLRHLFRADP